MSQLLYRRAGRSAGRLITGVTAVALPAAFAVSATTPAYAATPAQVSVVGGTTLAYGGGTEQSSNVFVFLENGEVTVTDAAPLTVGLGCRIVQVGRAKCGTGITRVSMTLGDRSDKVRIDLPLTGRVEGGDGDDTFLVNPTGTGFSRVTYDGGAGLFDTVDYSLRSVGVEASLDNVANDTGTGHRDNVLDTVEHLVGSRGSDTLIGSSARNVIDGRAGNDTLRGLGDSDKFLSGSSGD
ncbi:MAG: hypothetical protein ACLGIF_02530, partial [Actinomycetes bacterium]